MATIKIDRGFTQKIQAKGMIHSPALQPSPPPKKAPNGKKKPPVAVVAAGALITLVAVIALAVVLKKDDKKPKPSQAQAPTVVPTRAAAAPAPAAVKPGQVEGFADPDEEIYNKKPAAAEASPSVPPPKPAGAPPKRVERAIAAGSPQGLRCDYYENIAGKPMRVLREAAVFPSQPSRTELIGAFDLSENIGDRYGVRVRGYLVPAVSGTYRFSVCADDTAEFWLSEDASPDKLRKRVGYEGWILKGKWTERANQQSEPCELVAGQRYYLEALLKEDGGCDYLAVAWKGPVSGEYVVIDAAYLVPWSEANAAAAAPAAVSDGHAAREAAWAPAREAVAEQQRNAAAAYRYAAAAEALKRGRSAWTTPEVAAWVETEILRFELLARLRDFVQAELAKAPVRGVWTAFGGAADVTTASDEGVTVAPGRIVAWPKVPSEQFLRLIHATVPKANADAATKGALCLAAAVYCKEVSGGLDLALKYRERAVAGGAVSAAAAERALGGTPESLQAEVRIAALRSDLARALAAAQGLSDRAAQQEAGFAAAAGRTPGVLAEYWEENPHGSLKDAQEKGLLDKAPDRKQVLELFETPRDRAEQFVARLRGTLTPPETGDYYFYIAADDQGELWLSSDETPERKQLCVRTTIYCKYRVWDKEKHRSKPVRLVRGQAYYIEALMREGLKDDNLSIAWSPVAADTPELITSAHLSCSAREAFTPQARESVRQIEEDLRAVRTWLAECETARRADAAQAAEGAQASFARADAFQVQVNGAKEALRKADEGLKRIEGAVAGLKSTGVAR